VLSRSNGEGPVDEACFLLLHRIGVYNGVWSMPYINIFLSNLSHNRLSSILFISTSTVGNIR
jgi:hypothetical protein